MAGLTLEQLEKQGATRKGGKNPLESLQLKEPSLTERIGERFRERTEAGAESILATERKEQTLPEAGVQLAGQTAGFIFDIGGEALVSALKLVPGFIKEPVKDVAEEVLKSPIGQAGLKAISSGVEDYRTWKAGNPRAARNLEAVVNVVSLLPVGAGVKIAGGEAVATTGELAGKIARPLERSLAKQTLSETLEVIRPQLTKIQKQAALEAGRGTVAGKILPRRFEKITVKPTSRELEMANILDGIVTKSKNPIENIETIDSEIVKLATSVQEGLAENNAIFNKNQIQTILNKTKEESRVVFGMDTTLQNNYNAIVDEMMRQIETQPKTLSGLLQARKNFDKVIESKFPKILSNPLGDTARQNAIRDVRRAANDFIAEKLPEGNLFKARLRQQNLMYDAIKNISQKTAELVDASTVKKVMQALRQNPLVAGVTGGILTYGALMGMFSNPLVIGTLIAGGSIKLGKTIITSKTLKSLLIRSLRFLETQGTKGGNSESIKAINTILRKVDEGEISIGLTIREVGGENLTTKFLDYAKGKTTLSRQEIMDFARRPELKKGEADLLNRLVQEVKEAKLPAQEFADSIRRDLLELKPVKVKEPQYRNITIQSRGMNMVSDTMNGKNYEEIVFESPITTNGSSHFPNSKNYFAHARGDEVVEGGKKIWREQEIQSDLLQKDRLQNEFEGIGKDYKGQLKSDLEADKLVRQKELEKLTPFTNDRFGERIMRERIKEKASKGYAKYRLPTGETIGKIEGFGADEWRFRPNPADDTVDVGLQLSDLKVGREIAKPGGSEWIITDILGDGRFKAVPKDNITDLIINPADKVNYTRLPDGMFAHNNFKETFDLTGKSNPQYRRYQDWGKFLKNKFGGKEVVDPQGNSWMEIDLKKEMGRLPVEAFGIAPFTLQDEENK